MPLGALVPVLLHGSGGGVTPPSGGGLPVTVMIDGVDRTAYVAELSWRSGIGMVGSAEFVIEDITATWRPYDGDDVEFIVDGSTVWGGQVAEVDVTFLGWNVGWRCEVSANDWNDLPMREPYNGEVPAALLLDTLVLLTMPGSHLADQGITLSPSQTAGPALERISVPWKDDAWVLNKLALLANMIVWINPSKELRMWSPGDIPSGLELSLANGNLIGCSYTTHRFDYRNRQWLVFGPTDVHDVTDNWTGDGVTQDFDLHYSAAAHPSPIFVGGNPFPVGVYGVDAMPWTFEANAGSGNPQYGRFRHTGAAIGAGVPITATFPTNSPNAVFVTDGGEVVDHGRYGKVDFAPEVVVYEEAKALADALIRKNLPRPYMPVLTTYDISVFPGMTVDVDLLAIGLYETVLVHTVEVTTEKEGDGLRATATLSCFGNDWHGDLSALWLRLINGDSVPSGGGSTVTSGGGGGGGTTTVITSGPIRLHFGGWKSVNADVWQSAAGNGVAFDLPEGAEYGLVGAQVAGAILLNIHLATDAGANGEVSARLFNETDGVAASDWTSGVTAPTLTYVNVYCTLAATEKIYKVQLRVSGSAHATANIQFYNAVLENRL